MSGASRAGKGNLDFVKSIGAARTFDRADPHVVDVIVAAMQGAPRCVAISTETTLGALYKILHRAGAARKVVAAVAPGAEACATTGVVVKTNFQKRNEETEVGARIWRGFLERALVEGGIRGIRCASVAHVVGHGLGDVQRGVDVLAEGVSARKLVLSV